jgi:hypothetical protein
MQSEHPGHDWAGDRSKNDHYHLVLLLKDIDKLPDENEEFPLPRIRAENRLIDRLGLLPRMVEFCGGVELVAELIHCEWDPDEIIDLRS